MSNIKKTIDFLELFTLDSPAENNGTRANRIYTEIFKISHQLRSNSTYVLIGYEVYDHLEGGMKHNIKDVYQDPNLPKKIGHLSDLILYLDTDGINGSRDIECFDSEDGLKNRYLPVFRNDKLKTILENGNI